ncbi:signal peptidase II [Candidatus Peregrinibacteria bacterium]|nr:signal peptidase II [Candidatus Peregrinibacteria bacterium]
MKLKKLPQTGLIGIFLTLLDQLSKWWALQNFTEPLDITSFFSFRYEQNYGIAWSILIPMPLLIILHIALVIAIPVFAYKNLDMHKNVSLFITALVLGGALGNLYDRIFRGFVVDFIAFSFWPVFNLADAFLCIGIFLFVAFYGKIKRVS